MCFRNRTEKKTTKFSLRKSHGFNEKLTSIQDRIRDYVAEQCTLLPKEFPELPEDFEDDIIEIADFVTTARSIVLRDYRGVKNLALSAEYPMRVAKMMQSVAKMMIHLNKGVVTDEIRKCVYKVGFDCIPKQTKIALQILAKYYRVTSAGVGKEIKYPEARAQEWIENLNMYGIVDRFIVNKKSYWGMEEEYRKIMNKYFNIELSDKFLASDDESDGREGSSSWMD